jgi:uncharacterized repeat protein (TIGR01451 family)
MKTILSEKFWIHSFRIGLLSAGLGVALWASAPQAQAQVGVTLSGPLDAANCGTILVTNQIVNNGATLSGLYVTNDLPSSSYAYVPGLSTVSLPGGVVLTNAAADPDVNNNNTNLIWDFSAVVTPSTLTNLVVSEVYYNTTQSPEEENEWFEIYNPTTNAVTMTGWSVRDGAPGAVDALPNITIAAGEFVIVAGSTNAFMIANPAYVGQVFEVADGKIGSGLNNFGDGVLLQNAASAVVDAMSYGASTAAFSPSVPTVAAGHSLARDPADNDTNTRNDWSDQTIPDPGAGLLPVGIQNGASITIVYAVEIDCGAVGGQLFSRTGYEQPPGTPGDSLGSMFLTLNEPDLVVIKTPIMQDAGVGDTVSWTVQVVNAGFGGAPNVVAVDMLGPGLIFTGFSVAPTVQTASNAYWDVSAIPAFSNLAAQSFVDIAVTAQVVACDGLYNLADAEWGCNGLAVLTNETCEATGLINETATAGIRFVDRYPSLSVAVAPNPLSVDYCGGSSMTLYITNASGADIGMATNITFTPSLPSGWSLTGAAVDTNGIIHVDPLPAGTSTSVTVLVEAGGACPIDLTEQGLILEPDYTDLCGNPFSGPLVSERASVVSVPGASIIKIVPSDVSGDDGSFPVQIELTYSNFVGTESITVTDLFPVHTNLTVANISPGGVEVGNSVVWTQTPPAGSGILTSSFDMVIGASCGGPDRILYNVLNATSFTDCQGCPQDVVGDGYAYPIDIHRGTGCGTGTGGCDFASSVGVFPTLTEVCDPVMVTHTFTSFSGSLGDWTGVTFQSDLAGGAGTVDTTNEVTVLIDGSNVTSYVSITQATPSLVLDLTGLNGSSFPSASNVTTSLVIAWPVSVSTAGQYIDASSLTVGACGTEWDQAIWNVGESRMEIELNKIFLAEACTRTPGSIELTMIPSPEGVLGETALFPAYDTVVTLDLDFDGDALSGFSYLPGTTLFSNVVDLAGTPIPAFDPAISGDQLTWNLGDLGTNTDISIHYQLRPSCDPDTNGMERAELSYNVLCDDGMAPVQSDISQTNSEPFFVSATLINTLQPELQFLTDTQIVNQIRIMNTGQPDAFNLYIELDLPPGVSFGSAEIEPSSVTATQVVWNLHLTHTNFNPSFPLYDDDADGSYDDLRALDVLEFWVTNNLDSCTGTNDLVLRSSHGCKLEKCNWAPDSQASFATISGSLVTRSTFPVENSICETNPVVYSVRNSGLTVDYDVQAFQTLPTGMDYVSGSCALSINGGTTNAMADPPGTGLPGDPLTWTSTEIPLFAGLQPNDEVTLYYDVRLGCDAVAGDSQFLAEGRFTDLCGNIVSNREVVSVLAPKEPLLVVNKTSSLAVADLGETVVYTVNISHDGLSAADVPYLELTDILPAAVTYTGASVTPDAVIGQTLIWSNSTLCALTGDTVPPFAQSEGAISILVTGVVNGCAASVINQAVVDYGCSVTDSCLSASDSASIITAPRLSPPGLVSALDLTTCGGTKTVSVTNSGASTESDIIYVEYAPPGYIFTGATSSGEFTSAGLVVAYSGTPVGSIATVDFSTDVSSGATDAKDDIGDGLTNLELGKNSAFEVIWTLASAGDNLDCLADPTDLDYEDPDQGDPTSLTSSNRVDYSTLCGETDFALGSISSYPGIPNLDIDLQPNSLIVTNGEVVSFTLSVINSSETEDADNIYVRVKMGAGWNALTFVSSNIVSSGTDAMLLEQQGNTNLLLDFPGVILNPVNDEIQVSFTATATQGGGSLDAVAEVVGDCDNPLVIPQCTPTNVWGEAPYADSMVGAVLGPVNGQYSSFDQDRFVAAGHLLTKSVRYDEELAAAAGTSRTARVGEDLIYRLEAIYFGGAFTDVTITDSLPPELAFGTPTNYVFTGGMTGAVWNAGSGIFTLQPTAFTTNPSTFAVDIPVVVSNRMDVQDGVVITNIALTDFVLDGVTNVPVEKTTEVEIFEPVLQITKTVNSNVVQAGDIILFTNRLVHTGASATSAYSVVFSDTLPDGLVFDAFISPATGTQAGQTISFNTNDLAALGEFKTGDPAIEFVFSVLVEDQLVGATMTNISSATYVSLDNASENGNERDGSDGTGGLNDYITESSVTLDSQAVGTMTKTFVSSTQTNTLDGVTNDWTIGERFVYQIRVDIPQGVVSNLVVTDIVPAGIDWVGTNPDAAMEISGRGYEFEIPAGGPQFPTNIVDGLVITDPDPTPASSTTTDGSGDDIAFTFAAITNTADGSSANDYFLLRMEFVALDQNSNDGLTTGATISNNFAQAQDGFTTQGATGPVYRIVEHNIRARKVRSLSIADAGDTITFTLVASNQVTALANAYDIVATDSLSSNVYDFSTFTLVSVTPGWATALTGASGGRTFELTSVGDTALVPGSGAIAIFTIDLAQTVRPNQIYTNRIQITDSSTLYGPPPGGIVERDDTNGRNVTFTIPGLDLAKALEGTSETNNPPDSLGSDVQIGEMLTYRLAITLPESTITNLTVVDTLSNNGLAYVNESARLDTAGFVGTAGSFVENPTAAAPSLSSMGQQMTFSFTNVVVTGDNDTNNNTFYLLMDYLVLDDAANDGLLPGQTVHTNSATLTYGGNPGGVVTSAVVNTTVVEPSLKIFKSLTPTNDVSSTNTLSMTLIVTNEGTATAYDVAIEDVLDPLYYDIGDLANVVLPTGFVYEVVGNTFRILSDTNAPTGTNTIEIGESLTFTFDVGVAVSLQPNVTVTNVVTVNGDSLASTNIFDVQRYTGDTNEAPFVAKDFDPTKVLIATSETGPADSAGTNLQIGEVATYEISVQLPDLTVTDLEITDVMPDGMAYVVGSLVVLTNDLTGTFAPVTNITPNVGALGASGEDVVIIWVGDSVIGLATNGAAPILHVRLDAVVLDIPANVGVSPQTILTNSASITYSGNPNPPAVVIGPPVTLIEPELLITKTVLPGAGDAGDQITITLVATNSGLATAYDLDVSDLLDGLVFNTATVVEVTTPDGFVFAETPSGSDVIVSYVSDTNSYQATNTLEIGESLLFEFTVDLAQTVEPGAIYTNGVTLVTDTIYETNSVGIQRDYTNAAQDSLTISNMVVAKVLTGTSETGPVDTTGSDVTIGETASYALTVTLPEATVTNLAVADVIPVGMSYVAGSVVVDTTGFVGSLPGAPAVTTGGGSGDDVTFTFQGLTVVTEDNNGANNSFLITLDLLVLDVGSNTGLVAGSQTVLPNSATVAYDSNPPVATSTVVNVDVVEPLLDITKTMSAASNSLVIIDLVVTNLGLSTAFDVEIEDVLTTQWWDTATITPITVPTGFTFGTAGAPGDATITIATDGSSGQPTNSIEVGESLLFQFQAVLIDGAPTPVTNVAEVTEHSTIDGPNPDERDEPPVQDDDELDIPGYTISKVLTSPVGRSAEVGETVTFDLIVTNTRAIGLDPVLLEDTYDTTYLSYVSALPASDDNTDDGTINWTNVGPIAGGQAVTVAVQFVAIESTLPGDTTNQVVATPFTTNGLPLLPKTNEAPVEVVTVGYTLDKTNTNPGPTNAAQVGDSIEFTITVVNTGEVALATLPVEDTYDATYLTYVSSLPVSDDNTDDGTINWADIGPLPVGATTTIVASFTAASSTLSLPETNTVVTTPTMPPTSPPVPPKTNEAPYEVSSAGYTLEKDRTSPTGRPAIIGETVTFDILVTNTGDVALVTVPVEDTYETTYLTYVSSVPASDDNTDDGTINWADIGPLPVGASTTIVATFTGAADTLGVDHTNAVVTTPTTPSGEPPVPPKTNDAPYQVDTPASIGDFVWEDTNGNGIQDGGEPVITNVTVTLYDAATNSLGTTTTDASGLYAFTNLVPGTYFVGFTPPTGWQVTLQDQGGDDALDSDADPVTGYTIPTVLISGENDPTWDAGLYRPASLGDFVWDDLNADGIQDGGEVGVSNVVVTLYNTNDVVIGVTTTDVAGAYAFTNLPPFDYYVDVTPPAGYDVSPQNQGGDDAVDSDIDTTTGQTGTITLDSGEDDPTWDAGIYLPASLGDYVWEDMNGNGIQDGGEPVITNVTVTLYDAATNSLGTTATDAAGLYAFTNLVPGTYFVGFTPPTGYQITLQDQGGDDALDSDADQLTGYTAPTVLISGENDPTWDAGLYLPADLGDFIWDDLNADGIQDAGEVGVSNVVVTLYDTNAMVVGVTTTDVAGAYAFTNLPPADYVVEVTPPAGYDISPQDQGGDDAVDSDIDTTTGQTGAITLDSGESDPEWDGGLYIPASLGDFVWEDTNGNGIQDGGEPGITNVTVTLYDAATNSLGTTATDATGLYAFTNLVPGTYFVGFTPPTGYQITLQDQGGDDALDSDADPVTGYTIPTVLISGENDLTWDAGLYLPASLGDYVWDDLNADGIQDAGEVGVSNVVVTLYNTNDVVIGVTTTDVAGAYAFTNLPPFDYYVEVTPPAGYDVSPQNQGGDDAVDSDIDTTTGQTATITLDSGEDDPTWDAGLYLPARLGDFVWDDTNGNGIQDGGEPAVTNVTVTLYDAATNVLGTTVTDASGLYAFTNLVPETYFVGFTPPTGWQVTLQDQGGDDALDSDADQLTGYTAPTVLISGENDPTWDAGLYRPASLGDFVWDDLNGDGIQDASEPGIQSVVVTLYDADTNALGVTLTDAFGAYAFTNLPPEEYFVVFTRPAGYQFTLQDQGGDDTVDSDADPVTGTTISTVLSSGEDDPTWDAGMYRPASLGDYVWLDENWDGIQDPGEAGIPNVIVNLVDGASNAIAYTFTDLNGLYLFTDLPPGDYTALVDATTLATNLAANPTYDLDGNLNDETTVTLASGDEDLRLDFGYNWSPTGTVVGAIGDRVWIDDDADGLQDPGEPGISNVTVNLLIDAEGNGSYTTVVATAVTDAAGLYIFPNLDANSYVVQIDTNTLPVDFIQSGDPDYFAEFLPAGEGDHQTTTPIVLAPGDVFVNADFGYWPPTRSNLGDLIYFDANADGAFNPADGDYGIPGVTVVLKDNAGEIIASTITDGGTTNNYLFTGLQPGTYTVWVNDTANVLNDLVQTGDPDGGNDNLSTTTLDGMTDDLVQDHGYTPDRQEPLLGLIGDTIFLDRDNDGLPGPGEGVQGTTVYLFDSTGTILLATTVTDPNGHYYFGGLPAADYVVQVDTATLPNSGIGLVNTVDPDTANPGDSQSAVTLGLGEINLLQDFGYVPAVPNTIGGTLWRDCNADGILDIDEDPRWGGVNIVLRDGSGNIVGSMLTDTNGDYSFTGLGDGAYQVDVVDFANVVNGFWLSSGPNPGMDNNSQADPYAVAVAGGVTNTTGDFGYYLVTSELGDYVWYDINENGIQDGGEPGLNGVRVSLHIGYPGGEEIRMETTTDANGRYRFRNLLVDERYRAATTNDPTVAGLPRFTVSIVATQALLAADGYDPTDIDAGDGTNDSRNVTGTFCELAKCGRRVVYDFGFKGGPLLAVIGNVDAFTRDGETVVRWETIDSWNTAGFWLERQVGDEWVRISEEMIPFPILGVAPIVYEQIDPTAEAGGTYLYRLVELETDGDLLAYGPYPLTVDGPGRTYADWAAEAFTAEELADPAISGEEADPDGDGLTNLQEFLAGTDPTSADSVLQVTQVTKVDGGMELMWNAVAGRFYKVAIAESIFGPFLPLDGDILATDGQGSVTLDLDFSDRQLYFQIITVGSD